MSLAALSFASAAQDSLQFSGTLRAHACTLKASDRNIDIQFPVTGTRDLYLGRWPAEKQISLHLENCDPRVAADVETAFSGAVSAGLPGALTPDNGSSAEGIALVLMDDAKRELVINGSAHKTAVSAGDNVLNYYVQIRAEPAAQAQHKIIPGTFVATAQFELSYP